MIYFVGKLYLIFWLKRKIKNVRRCLVGSWPSTFNENIQSFIKHKYCTIKTPLLIEGLEQNNFFLLVLAKLHLFLLGPNTLEWKLVWLWCSVLLALSCKALAKWMIYDDPCLLLLEVIFNCIKLYKVWTNVTFYCTVV